MAKRCAADDAVTKAVGAAVLAGGMSLAGPETTWTTATVPCRQGFFGNPNETRRETHMKKVAATTLAAGAIAVATLALAPLAAADPTPPVAPGLYTMQVGGNNIPEQVAWNCGPSCFTLGSPGSSSPRDYHFDAASGQWRNGAAWTVDGVHFNADGDAAPPGVLVPV